MTSPWGTTVWVERTRRLLLFVAAIPLLSLTFRAKFVMQRRSDLEEACVCHNVSDGFWFVINRRSVLLCVLLVRRTSFSVTTWQTWEALTACCAPSSYLAMEALEAQETRQPLTHNYLKQLSEGCGPQLLLKPMSKEQHVMHTLIFLRIWSVCYKYCKWNVKTVYIPQSTVCWTVFSYKMCVCVCLSLATVCVCVNLARTAHNHNG